MKLCIIGTGYVGLVSAACFAEMGNSVTCVDVNPDVVKKLNAGSVHIFEPGLAPMVQRSRADGRLTFTTELADGLKDADCAFICVGTPPGEDGSCDLHYVEQVARQIGRLMEKELEPKRYQHTLGVAYTAAALAMRYNADMDKALIAGLLHDCAKNLSVEKQFRICTEYLLSERWKNR